MRMWDPMSSGAFAVGSRSVRFGPRSLSPIRLVRSTLMRCCPPLELFPFGGALGTECPACVLLFAFSSSSSPLLLPLARDAHYATQTSMVDGPG